MYQEKPHGKVEQLSSGGQIDNSSQDEGDCDNGILLYIPVNLNIRSIVLNIVNIIRSIHEKQYQHSSSCFCRLKIIINPNL